MKTVFAKLMFIVVLVFSLIILSCNTNQQREGMRGGQDENEQVRGQRSMDRDTTSVNRERNTRDNDNGYGDTRNNNGSDVDLERDRD
ncbi:MAG TPA: hypothetical protein VHO50_02485 [Bacteroidales bacterium]|nr:hypothetical protein [Bacteroidales bacterium]